MKKLSVIILAFISSVSFIYAQEIPDERQQFMFDSVMHIMRDKSISFTERNSMTKYIADLTRKNQIAVFNELLPEAKEYKDKSVITRLYSLMGLFSAQLTNYSDAKVYLDSALFYADKIDNYAMKGLANYCMGIYYAHQNKMTEAHNYYYRAAEFYKLEDPQHPILYDIYYDLSIIYDHRNDLNSLKELMKWMEEISVDPIRKIFLYTMEASYFDGMYKRTGELSYLDSLLDCNRNTFDLYLAQEYSYDVGYQVANNYFMQADAFYSLNQYDSAKIYLNKAIELDDPDNFYGILQFKLLKSKMLFNEERFDEIESELKEGLLKLEDLKSGNDINLYKVLTEYYTLLSQTQEKQGKMKDALNSERESQKFAILHFDLENNEYVQSLRAKYDLDNKQRSIDQLTAINKMYERNRYLYGGIGVLFFIIIILLIIFLSRRKRKIVQAQLHEVELISQLEQEKNIVLSAKMDENEQKYQRILSENKLRQINSYLAGLETERSRLSKELHDNVANNILSVSMLVMNKENINASQISQQLSNIQEQVRNISHELIPPVFQYATFIEILKDYIHQQNEHSNMKIILSIESEDRINKVSEKTGLELYRIIQECISNIFKHAQASNVEVILYVDNHDHLNITVVDDGKGFDIDKKYQGIGIAIIKERVKSLHGNLTINSAIDKGTEVSVDILIDDF